MKVSVLVPVYNKAEWLAECLRSILDGQFRDLEVVAVDDRSTDDSLAMLRAIDDPRLRVIALPENRGPAGAANAGLDACQGEYIVRQDADDVAFPDRIATQVAFMDAHPDVGVSGGHLQLFGAGEGLWKFPLTDADCRASLLFACPLAQPASIMRRAVLDRHHLRYGADWPRIGEDWLFWSRFSRHTRFANLDRPLVHYRRGEQNLAHGRDKLADHQLLMEDLFAYFRVPHRAEDIDLHLMAMTLFRGVPKAADVRALHRWLAGLVAWNDRTGEFPTEAFQRQVRRVWDRLFHYLADRGTGLALTHMSAGSGWSMGRLGYLASVRLRSRNARK